MSLPCPRASTAQHFALEELSGTAEAPAAELAQLPLTVEAELPDADAEPAAPSERARRAAATSGAAIGND